MFQQVPVCRSCADLNFARKNLSPPQLGKIPDTDQLASRKSTCCILHHYICAAGDGKPCSRLLCQKQQHGGQRTGTNELVVARMGSHASTPRRAASTTASMICVYPVQRQRLPDSPSAISATVGFGFLLSR